MARFTRILSLFALLSILSLSAFAQGWYNAGDVGQGSRGSVVGEVIDVSSGAQRVDVETDGGGRITIDTDAVTTQYNGFGTVIAGKPEIFIGSRGFSNLRVGDRISVRGTGRAGGSVLADQVTLVGRAVAASPVGVGGTRSPSTSVSTPVDERPGVTSTSTANTAEGIVRSISERDGRLVIETPQRRMITIRTYRNTPVYFQGQQFTVTNLEPGDRIRVEADPRDAQTDEITARRIDVIQSVQDSTDGPSNSATVTVLEGRVARIDTVANVLFVTTREDEIRVDMTRAQDADGDRMGARDLRVGDRVEISGSFNRAGDVFLASTVRSGAGVGGGQPRDDDFIRYSVVTLNGTVTETLDDATTLAFRDRDSGRIVRLWVTEDFIVVLKNNVRSTADKLRVNDDVRIKAFRDEQGSLVAQSVTVRNR